MTRFVSIAEFWNVYDAATAAAALESAGILALNPDWHFFHLKPHILFGSTGARIWVLETDLKRAAEILRAGHQQREPIHVCPDCDSEAYRSSALSVVAFLSSFFIAGAAGGAVFAALAQRSTRLHCPACDKAFRENPPAPFTESELGYDPQGPALGEWLRNGYQKLISLRKL